MLDRSKLYSVYELEEIIIEECQRLEFKAYESEKNKNEALSAGINSALIHIRLQNALFGEAINKERIYKFMPTVFKNNKNNLQ